MDDMRRLSNYLTVSHYPHLSLGGRNYNKEIMENTSKHNADRDNGYGKSLGTGIISTNDRHRLSLSYHLLSPYVYLK